MGFAIDFTLLYLGVALIVFILAKHAFGALDAYLQGQFDKNKFKVGLLKGLVTTISLVAIYGVGILNEGIIKFDVMGQQMGIIEIIYLIVLYGCYRYGKDAFEKVMAVLGIQIPISDKSQKTK